MLTIWGIVLLAAGIFIAALGPRLLPKLASGSVSIYLGTALVLMGAGLQVYETWRKLPPHCRTVLSLSCDPAPPAKSRRR